jgi:CSLREA domain-containing protein
VIIDGNHLGAASNGTADGGVTGFGVRVIDSPNVSITDNLISGNDLGGVYVSGADSDGASITGNTVGLNLGGDDFLEATPTTDQDGIRLLNVPNAVIGGSGAAGRNIIAGNYGDGIEVSGTAAGTTIDGNSIGTSAIGEDAIPNANAGIRLDNTSGVSVGSTQGNLISGNSGPGVVVTGSTDVTISDNLIGLDVDGDTVLGNTSYGINISGSSVLTIDNNTVSGNTGSGIHLSSGTAEIVLTDNRIGVGASSLVDLGNTNHGIYIDNSHDNRIGSTITSLGNIIAYNNSNGIFIRNTDPATYNSYGNTIIGNSIFNNGGLGIDLAPSGVTPNDGNDADDGPNYLQNFITFTAKKTDTGVQITGELNTDSARPNYRIEFFQVNNCDASGYGEGRTFVDTFDLTVIGNTTAIDYEIPDTSIPANVFLTSTVTYDEGTGGLKDTSEFSPCAVVQEPDSPGSSGVFVVNSTSDAGEAGVDIGDGECNIGGGVCTLRAAIQEANAGSEPPYTITFNIAGAPPHTISLGSALDSINVPVLLRGEPSGYTGPPLVILDGSGAGVVDGLNVSADGSKVDGLSMVNFSAGSAIVINAAGVTASNNYLGLLPDGTTTGANLYGLTINAQTGNMVTGNIISGNTHGVRVVGSAAQNNTISSNYIGTDASGTLDRGNSSDGIRLEGSQLNTIEGNLISGNNSDGIEVTGAANGNNIFDNLIGVRLGGSGNLGNIRYGININSSFDNFVANGNTIAYNGLSGVFVSIGTGNLISENSIFSNVSSGIDLASGGNLETPAPTLFGANQGGTYIFVEGELTGAIPDTEYTLEFFRNSNTPQGEALIYSTTVVTDGSGNISFTAGPPVVVPDLTLITASATDPDNNTSEFSNGVYVLGGAPVLTETPTFTPTITNTPTPTEVVRPTWTFTPTNTASPTDTPTNTPTSTNTPTATTEGGGSGGATATNTPEATNTPTVTNTPTITSTPTLLAPLQTLTALATANTIEPTFTPVTPTLTKVSTQTLAPATGTPTATLDLVSPPEEDGTGGGGDGTGGGDVGGVIQDLFGGGNFTTILWIFIGLAVLLLLAGGAMELVRWLNSRE